MKTDPRYLLVNLYPTISSMVIKTPVRTNLSWEVYSWILLQLDAPGSWCSNKADILIEIMHLYNTEGLTCYWRIRGNE